MVENSDINNIISNMKNSSGVRLHNHKRKLKQRFDIIKKLGQGTYGKVQLGINKETGEEVAIKTIKKSKIETEADLIRIKREIQIMSSVQHPNIIHIFEVFENREKIVLVMEYAAGGELYDYLNERKILTENEARRLFRQIVMAVFYCHKHQICHRDLKLENILLDQSGNAKIADFGLSNVFDDHQLLNTFCGSPLYASPEIVKGTPYNGPEVDCWSLGVLLYTLVYGAMPFDGSNFKKLVEQITNSDYFEPNKPSPASTLIKDMLTVRSSQRANIEIICSHWWINEGYERNCLDLAKDLVRQTPVKLNLLLSIVPQSVSDNSNHLNYNKDMSKKPQEILTPIRCYSTGSIIDLHLEKGNINKLPKDIVSSNEKKLYTAYSVDETHNLSTQKEENDRIIAGFKHDSKVSRFLRGIDSDHVSTSQNVSKNQLIESKSNEFITCADFIKKIKSEQSTLKKQYDEVLLLPHQIQSHTHEVSVDNMAGAKDVINSSSINCISSSVDRLEKFKKPDVSKQTMKSIEKSFQDVPNKTASIDNKSKINVQETTNQSISNCSEEKNINEISVIKNLKDKSFSHDSELSSTKLTPNCNIEGNKFKITKAGQNFSQISSFTEVHKPKKFFIQGVDVNDTKLEFEKKFKLSPTPIGTSGKNSRNQNDNNYISREKVQNNKLKDDKNNIENKISEKEKKRAVSIIKGALKKPPGRIKLDAIKSFSNKKSSSNHEIIVDNDQNISQTCSSNRLESYDVSHVENLKEINPDQKKCSKLEITLKSATLPRPRKMSKAKITLTDTNISDAKESSDFGTKQANIFQQKARSDASCSLSLKHEKEKFDSPKQEHIIPIQLETFLEKSTVDSDTNRKFKQIETTSIRSELIKKSPREYIIPIILEGEEYTTSKIENVGCMNGQNESYCSTKLKPYKSKNCQSFSSTTNTEVFPVFSLPRAHSWKSRKRQSTWQSQQLQDNLENLSSEDEHGVDDDDDDDDDDDGFELLTAENLFSTLLSRVKCLTHRLNDNNFKFSHFPSREFHDRFSLNTFQN